MRVLRRWFPDRPFVCAGDTGLGNHESAQFASRPSRRTGWIM
jgi:hypothetical protein